MISMTSTFTIDLLLCNTRLWQDSQPITPQQVPPSIPESRDGPLARVKMAVLMLGQWEAASG